MKLRKTNFYLKHLVLRQKINCFLEFGMEGLALTNASSD